MTITTDYRAYDKSYLTTPKDYDLSTDISDTLFDSVDKMFPNDSELRFRQKSKVLKNAYIFRDCWTADVITQVKHICDMVEKATMENKFSLACENPLQYKDLFPVLARVLYQHNIVVENVKIDPRSTYIPSEMMISFGDNFKELHGTAILLT